MEFIYECEDFFPVDFCNRVIEKFEKSDLKFMGMNNGDTNKKKSVDLRIYDEPEWAEEEKYFGDMIREATKKYKTFLTDMDTDDEVKRDLSNYLKGVHVYPPQIQRTKPGQYYHWHHDQLYPPNWKLITYIIYLNTVEKDSGGTTEFSCGKTIQPKVGKIIFFPSTWTYYHRGKTLEKGVKYIATNALVVKHPREFSVSRRQVEEQNKQALPFITRYD
jgi:hypothetical protein